VDEGRAEEVQKKPQKTTAVVSILYGAFFGSQKTLMLTALLAVRQSRGVR